MTTYKLENSLSDRPGLAVTKFNGTEVTGVQHLHLDQLIAAGQNGNKVWLSFPHRTFNYTLTSRAAAASFLRSALGNYNDRQAAMEDFNKLTAEESTHEQSDDNQAAA